MGVQSVCHCPSSKAILIRLLTRRNLRYFRLLLGLESEQLIVISNTKHIINMRFVYHKMWHLLTLYI